MKKWSVWLIVAAIIVFVLCLVIDAIWIEGVSIKEMEKVTSRESVKPEDRFFGLFGAVFFYGIAGITLATRIIVPSIWGRNGGPLRVFLFAWGGVFGLASYCLMISLGIVL